MKLSLNPDRWKRYHDIARFLIRHGRSDIVRHAGLDRALSLEEPLDPEVLADARSLAHDLEELGPTFVKLGQLLSTRPDLLPLPYIEELAKLQDEVAPFSYEEVQRIVSVELGLPVSRAFKQFDPEPLAAASLGQVHKAVLHDGTTVAVKVQRPRVREQVLEDLTTLMEIAVFLDNHTRIGAQYRFAQILDEFRKSLIQELDYRREARNLAILRRNMEGFSRILVPAPLDDYTASRVLTMEFVGGRKITSLKEGEHSDIDRHELAEEAFYAYMQQVFVDGFFHADPHPGNVFLTDDGRLALLDLGMVARVAPGLQDKLLEMMFGVAEGYPEDAADVALSLGEKLENFDETAFRRRTVDLIMRHRDDSVEDLQVGRIVLEIARISGECGIRVPSELTMLAKTFLNLDQVGHILDPTFNPHQAVRRYAARIMRQRMTGGLSPGRIFKRLIDIKELAERLPRSLLSVVEQLADNEMRVKLDVVDERQLMAAIQKVANRITLGLLLAALIIGAALLTNVPTSFKIMGYPGIAIIFFLLAAAGAIALMLDIVLHDRRPPRS